MKFTHIATFVFVTIYAAISISMGSRPAPIDVLPALPASLSPGHLPPANIACGFAYYEHPGYQYCLYNADIDLIVEHGEITRTYMFLRDSQSMTIGQLINELGEPIGANYMREGVTMVRWSSNIAGVLVDKNFSPASKVYFVGWGYSKSIKFDKWRGFISSGN